MLKVKTKNTASVRNVIEASYTLVDDGDGAPIDGTGTDEFEYYYITDVNVPGGLVPGGFLDNFDKYEIIVNT